MDLAKYINFAIEKIEQAGYEAYLVGGAVRDQLLNRPVNDYDLTTSAEPEEVEEIFSSYKTLETGKAFGTIRLIIDGHCVEITTYRTETGYDGRRPSRVSFTMSLEEDLKRRDFTINSMAYNPKTGLVDIFGGKKDLEDKVIRSIGSAKDRMKEDYLRIMRAVRFASQLDFTIDEELYQALEEEKDGLSLISKERIREEFDKILVSPKPSKGIGILYKLGILEFLSKDLARMKGFDQKSTFHSLDLYDHTMMALDNTPPVLKTRLAALFHDAGKPKTFFLDERGEGRFFGHQNESAEILEDFMKNYKYSKDMIKSTTRLVARHMDNTNTYTLKSVRKLSRRMEDDLDLLFDLQEADVLATTEKGNLDNVKRARALAKEIKEKDLATEESQLTINGKDLIDIGYEEGKLVGDCLAYLLERVIDDDSLNTRENLLALAKDYKGGR